ncbi:MAG: CarD family transcriptional regulator [Oscillospiraceae bacterium]|jgi:CarD family transcriptional regulator
MYQSGDMVVHPNHGGCVIKGICTREIGGKVKRFYVLVPKSDPNTTILDPVEGIHKIGLQDIISAEEADEILAYVADVEPCWIKENAKRKVEYAAILKEGSLNDVAKMIKELMLQAQRVSLNQSDRILLQNAKKKLFSVIALAKGMELEQVSGQMNEALQLEVS